MFKGEPLYHNYVGVRTPFIGSLNYIGDSSGPILGPGPGQSGPLSKENVFLNENEPHQTRRFCTEYRK